MTRRVLISIIIAVVAVSGIAGVWYLYGSDLGSEPEALQTFTPPPLSENPPFNGAAIDELAEEYEKKGGR